MQKASYIVCAAFLIFLYPGLCTADFDHSLFDSLLSQYVHDGLVDYSGIKNDPSLLSGYLAALENTDSVEYASWGKPEKIAFWINAYNAITLYGVIQNYPIKPGGLFSRLFYPDNSIRQISGFFDKDFSRVMGKEITLDEIEHGILREKFDEPRIHFALVCASLSCPKLQSYAYKPDSLDLQLDKAAWEFIDTKGVIIDRPKNRLLLSKIFDWYAEDFQYNNIPSYLSSYDDDRRGFLEFIIDHSPNEIQEFIKENAPKIKFMDYDWTLNELRK
jgi:hypothetical protein